MIDDLGSLPKADRNSELQELSVTAFRAALPVDKFVFRDERINDAGVDGSLEVKIDSRYTNLRAQVQLKSTDSNQINQDGSVSIQVAVANLNYLLNGHSPLYVLYIVPRNELRFVWARDERHRLDEENPTWNKQDTITIRFYSVLTTETSEQIHQHIINEERMHRHLNDILSAASNTETLVVGISPETLNVIDHEEAKRVLLSSGMLIVTAGYSEQVRKLAKLLDSESEQLPRILLVRAYAEHFLGRYQAAYALLSEAMLRRDELSEDDKQFMDFLRNSCEYLTGRVTIQEFSNRINRTVDLQGHFAQSYRIHQLRYSLFLTRDPSKRKLFLEEFHSLVNQVIDDSTSSEVFKLYARASLLEAEGLDAATGFFIQLAEASVGLDLGRIPNIPGIIKSHTERVNKWSADIAEAIKDAQQLGHYRLVASAILTHSTVQFHLLISTFSLNQLHNIPPPQISEAEIQKHINDIEAAIKIFSRANDPEGELRAKLITADFYDLIGNEAHAQEIALEVLPKAEALGYARQIEHAKDHIEGRGLISRLKSSKRQKTEEERIIENADFSDDKVREYAAQMLRILELPTERLPVMEHEYFSIRGIAREKFKWCRHIELLQDLRHTQNFSTMYRRDPPRVCVCNLHQYKSILEHPDWEIVIAAFKRTYCEGCSDRNPFQT
ncbi:MAG TPA: DUF4365 domain-containing protein [Pyrinomonadaceae bacterium]